MSENLRKLIGVAVMAAIVVVGVVVTSGDDSDSSRTRNVAFGLPKGAGLDAQVQQPGDAENDLVIAMAAAAKCEEGHVLISTGDPVSPWRCGPLLSEMATVGIEDARPLAKTGGLGNRPCQWASALGFWAGIVDEHSQMSQETREDRLLERARHWGEKTRVLCFRDHASGVSVEVVRDWLEWAGYTNVAETTNPAASGTRHSRCFQCPEVKILVDSETGLVDELVVDDYDYSQWATLQDRDLAP